MADPFNPFDIKGPVTLTINGEHHLEVTNFRATPKEKRAPLPRAIEASGSFTIETRESDRAFIERLEAALFPLSRYWARRTEYHRRRMNQARRRGRWVDRVMRYIARAQLRRP